MSFELKQIYGIVAETFKEDDPKGTIKVLCPEKAPFTSGDLSHKEEDVVFTTEDLWGERSVSSCKTTNTVPAIFFGGNSGISIPDVVKGEQIWLITYGDSGTYYWRTARKDESLRKNEHYKISCAADPNRIKELNDDNTYFVELNSKPGKKKVHIKTSKKDGEAFFYELLVDVENNKASLNDNVGNAISLDSKGTVVSLKNADGVKVEANKKNLLLFAPEAIYLNSPRVMLSGVQLITDFKTGIIGMIKMILNVASLSKE